jgi:aminopeptidase N
MIKKCCLFFALLFVVCRLSFAGSEDISNQSGGPLLKEQAAYDVQFYDLNLNIDPEQRSIAGVLTVQATIVAPIRHFVLDLDSALTVSQVTAGKRALNFEHRQLKVWIALEREYRPGEQVEIAVTYAGRPKVAAKPPWDGGFIWSKTQQGQHWVGVTCPHEGADIWWPAKDHPSDEPDNGVALHFTVPSGLTVVSNGQFRGTDNNSDDTITYHWRVTTPINLYNVTFNLGPFVAVSRDYQSISGRALPMTFWVLPEDVDIARRQMPEFEQHMRFVEKTLGPYPFQGDKFALVETPYIAMEHQTNIAHGKAAMAERRMGILYIPLHELAHEWWGNLVSANDFAHYWLQEGFAGYTEALYAEKKFGLAAYHEYIARFVRPGVLSRTVTWKEPTTGHDAFEKKAYLKSIMVLHSLRYLLGDKTFFELLRRQAYPSPPLDDLEDCGQCRVTDTAEFIALANTVSGQNLNWFFDLYLYRAALPTLITEDRGESLLIRWQVPTGMAFPMPIEIEQKGIRRRVAMPNGETVIRKQVGEVVLVDPDFLMLRHAKPHPDQFGTLGTKDYAGLQSEKNKKQP